MIRTCTCALSLGLLAAAAHAAPRAVLVSVDGLRPDAITPEHAPRMTLLRARGVAAARAVNDLPSVTMTNHASMLTGLHPDRHHVLLDFELPGRINAPTIFDALHDAGLRSAFFASKEKLRYLARDDRIETIDITSDTAALTDHVLDQLTPGGPDFIFVHLRDPDSVGHAHGWLSPLYYEAVLLADSHVGRIVDALDADPSRPSYLLLTADHGGEGTNHFLNVPADRLIPWIIVGPDIPAAVQLPGEVSTADAMPTLLALLDVPVPPGLDGRVQPVRSPSDAAPGANAVTSLGLPCMLVATPALYALWRIAVTASAHTLSAKSRFIRRKNQNPT